LSVSPQHRRCSNGKNIMQPSNNSMIRASDSPNGVDWLSSGGPLSNLSREEQDASSSNYGGRRLSDVSLTHLSNLVARRLSGCDNGITSDYSCGTGLSMQNMMCEASLERLIAERRIPSLTLQDDLNARRRRRSSMSQQSQSDYSTMSHLSRRKSLELVALECARRRRSSMSQQSEFSQPTQAVLEHVRRRRSSMSQQSDFSQTTQQLQRECFELAALEKATRNNSLDLLGDVAALASTNSSISAGPGSTNNVDGAGSILKNTPASGSPNKTSLDLLSDASIALSVKNARDNEILAQSLMGLAKTRQQRFPFEQEESNQLFDETLPAATTFPKLGVDQCAPFGILQPTRENGAQQQMQQQAEQGMKQAAQQQMKQPPQYQFKQHAQQQMQQHAQQDRKQQAQQQMQQHAQQDRKQQAQQQMLQQAQQEMKQQAQQHILQQAQQEMKQQQQMRQQAQQEMKQKARQQMREQAQQEMKQQAQQEMKQQVQEHIMQRQQARHQMQQQVQQERKQQAQHQMQQQAQQEMKQQVKEHMQQQAQQEMKQQAQQQMQQQAQQEMKQQAQEQMQQQAQQELKQQAQQHMQQQAQEHMQQQAQEHIQQQAQHQMHRQTQNNTLSNQAIPRIMNNSTKLFDELNSVQSDSANYSQSLQSASFPYGSQKNKSINCKATNTIIKTTAPPKESITQRLPIPQSPETLNSSEPLLQDFSKSIQNSQKSQKNIQSWDKKMGLKRSHSATMTKTTQSRNRIKKFLENLAAPFGGSDEANIGRSLKKRKTETAYLGSGS